MYLVDTHTHIYSEEFDSDISEVIGRAQAAGVQKFCLPNVDIDSIDRLHRLCDRFSDSCFPMMGLHPTEIKVDFREKLEIIRQQFDRREYIAVGEIGIDLYWDKTFLNEQIEAFETQLQWSLERDLPVSIHSRDAFPEVFASLKKVGANRLRGVFHSFGGSREELEQALAFPQFYLGINGVITYKKADFREYLSLAPLSRILLETDAPYLTPVPFRGKRNEPAYLQYVVKQLSEVYSCPEEEIARQTTENACRLFDI
ncbi:MAG: TatD family hydrolase [Dysgonamonadaceae bacterium]|jgi:TatD DNase family protein|nr:TatD family hydrolase [Dysgonamonadaceae bacterium]